ncbi:MAG: hypothetical protein V1725_04545 [archaeon]
MSWYKFWKRSGPAGILDEDYKWIADNDHLTEESIKYACEYWSEHVGGGFNTHYRYGFEKVDVPPKEVLEKKIESLLKYSEPSEGRQKRIDFLVRFLQTYLQEDLFI